MEDGLGPVAAPPHAGSVEAYADEVADGPFDHAAADRQVFTAEMLVSHPASVLGESRITSVRQLVSQCAEAEPPTCLEPPDAGARAK